MGGELASVWNRRLFLGETYTELDLRFLKPFVNN